MTFDPHNLAANLPPPREDEPASLRQDIIDELTDHLESAARAEYLRGNRSEEQVREAVLDRFGEPEQIARRLWRDAIRENPTMAQRWTMILAAASTAACIAVSILFWLSMRDSRRAQLDALGAQSAANQKMIDELATIAARTSVAGTNWMPLRVKLVDESGKPVAGTVSYDSNASGQQFHEWMKADSSGLADFGSVPGGIYKVTIELEQPREETSEQFLVGPGRSVDFKIVCPTAPPNGHPVKFQIQPLAGKDASKQYMLFEFRMRDRQFADRTWTANPSRDFYVLVDPTGKILGQIDPQDCLTPVPGGDAFKPLPSDVPLKPLPPGFGGYAFEHWSGILYEADATQSSQGGKMPSLHEYALTYDMNMSVNEQADASVVVEARPAEFPRLPPPSPFR